MAGSPKTARPSIAAVSPFSLSSLPKASLNSKGMPTASLNSKGIASSSDR
jgi:hypothetical protein